MNKNVFPHFHTGTEERERVGGKQLKTHSQNFNVTALVLQIATKVLQSGLDLKKKKDRKKEKEKRVITPMITMKLWKTKAASLSHVMCLWEPTLLELAPSGRSQPC